MILKIKARPGSKTESISWDEKGFWLVKIKAQPVDGKANNALIAYLAGVFKLRQNQLTIKSGLTAKLKTIELDETPELIKFLDALKNKA